MKLRVVGGGMTKREKELLKPFAAALSFFLNPETHMKKTHNKSWLAKQIGVSNTFIGQLAAGKRYGAEDTRRKIPPEFGCTYEEFINIGNNLTGKKTISANPLSATINTPEIAELISMARDILNSGTQYANSLDANIRAFHHAIRLENEITDLRSDRENDRRQNQQGRRKKERDSTSDAIEYRSGKKDRRSRGGA